MGKIDLFEDECWCRPTFASIYGVRCIGVNGNALAQCTILWSRASYRFFVCCACVFFTSFLLLFSSSPSSIDNTQWAYCIGSINSVEYGVLIKRFSIEVSPTNEWIRPIHSFSQLKLACFLSTKLNNTFSLEKEDPDESSAIYFWSGKNGFSLDKNPLSLKILGTIFDASFDHRIAKCSFHFQCTPYNGNNGDDDDDDVVAIHNALRVSWFICFSPFGFDFLVLIS